MFVIEAQAMGMCFGVRDALAAMRAVQTPRRNDRVRAVGA